MGSSSVVHATQKNAAHRVLQDPLLFGSYLTLDCKGRATAMNNNQKDIIAIKQLREDYMKAQGAGDVEGCLSFWTDDGVLMPPNAPSVSGKQALRTTYTDLFNAFKLENKVFYDVIEAFDGISFARGRYRGQNVPKGGGAPIPEQSKFLEIHKKQKDGTWKFAYHMWSFDE